MHGTTRAWQQPERRMVLGALGALAVAGPLNAARSPAASRFFERIGVPIGLQLYMLGDAPRRDPDAAFASVVSIGYRDAQLPQLYGLAPAALKAAADRAGLTFSSLHLPAPGNPSLGRDMLAIDAPAQRIADVAGALGIRRVVLPIFPFIPMRSQAGESFGSMLARATAAAGPDLWQRTAALLNTSAAAFRPLGIEVGYHNHNVEFAPVAGTTGWDILWHETDPRLIRFEIDIGWVAAAGLDPVAFLDRSRGRIAELHVKDMKASTRPNFALAIDSTQVGAGSLDWEKILPAAYRAGARRFYVEQEPPFAIPPLDAARQSFQFLDMLKA